MDDDADQRDEHGSAPPAGGDPAAADRGEVEGGAGLLPDIAQPLDSDEDELDGGT